MDEIPPQVPGYRLTRLLGAGSTSTVWRARRDADDELVAIKLLGGGSDEEAVREFAMLQHAADEHVVTLHETLEVTTDAGPAIAIVLQYLAGGSLGRVVAERGHLTPGETVTVIAPIAQAVAGLHDLGIVHGDLSPGNVLLDSTGRPVLSDLGFSRLTGEAAGDVHGTDGYVAPEVLEGGDPARESDVHALGALAWLCLVGSPPGHIAERLDLRDLLPGEPELADAVESALATDPSARPEADEIARAIFDAAPAQPLRMTATGDVASSLTRRIREAAHDGEREGERDGEQGGVRTPQWQRELALARPAAARRRWWQARDAEEAKGEPRTRSTGGRHAATRRVVDKPLDLTRDEVDLGRDVSEPRAIARSATTGPRGGRLTAVLITAALAVALAVVVPWHQLASAGDGSGGSAGQGPGAGGVGTGEVVTGPGAAGDEPRAQNDRSAPRQSPTALAQELTTLRQQMVLDLDRSVLDRLDEGESPAARRDEALIAQLRESGHRYRGVRMTARSAQLQRTTGATAVLRTTIDESAYVVVAPDGSRSSHAARRGQRVDLLIAWDGEQWRVRDVLAVG